MLINLIYLIQEFNEKSPKCFENVFLKEVASGKSINKEILKLLPVEKLPLKNCDTCILTYFENFNTLYVAKVFESDNIKILHEIASNTGYYFKIVFLLSVNIYC